MSEDAKAQSINNIPSQVIPSRCVVRNSADLRKSVSGEVISSYQQQIGTHAYSISTAGSGLAPFRAITKCQRQLQAELFLPSPCPNVVKASWSTPLDE